MGSVSNYYQTPQIIKMPRTKGVITYPWACAKDMENRVVCGLIPGKK